MRWVGGLSKRVLLYLDRHPNSRITDIALALKKSKSQISRCVRRQIDKGWLNEHRSHPLRTGSVSVNYHKIRFEREKVEMNQVFITIFLVDTAFYLFSINQKNEQIFYTGVLASLVTLVLVVILAVLAKHSVDVFVRVEGEKKKPALLTRLLAKREEKSDTGVTCPQKIEES